MLLILKCIGFFILIEVGFILIGGSATLLLSEKSSQLPTIASALSFPISVIVLGLFIKWKFPLVLIKCTFWLLPLRRNLIHFFLSLAGIFVLFIIILSISKVNGIISPLSSGNDTITLNVIASLFIITLMVGISEEIIYRGFIFAYFIEKVDIKTTTIIISMLFSLMHSSYIGILPYVSAFIMGVVSIILILKTGSLFASIGLHTGWNLGYFVFQNRYNIEGKSIPFWGSPFELYQIGLLTLILIILLLFIGRETIVPDEVSQ